MSHLCPACAMHVPCDLETQPTVSSESRDAALQIGCLLSALFGVFLTVGLAIDVVFKVARLMGIL